MHVADLLYTVLVVLVQTFYRACSLGLQLIKLDWVTDWSTFFIGQYEMWTMDQKRTFTAAPNKINIILGVNLENRLRRFTCKHNTHFWTREFHSLN